MTQQTGTQQTSTRSPAGPPAGRPTTGEPVPQQTAPADRAGAALDQLRTYLAALVDVIDGHPEPSMERDEAHWRLRELVDELAPDEPAARRVRSRWLRLVPPLTEVRPDVPVDRLSALLDAALPLR